MQEVVPPRLLLGPPHGLVLCEGLGLPLIDEESTFPFQMAIFLGFLPSLPVPAAPGGGGSLRSVVTMAVVNVWVAVTKMISVIAVAVMMSRAIAVMPMAVAMAMIVLPPPPVVFLCLKDAIVHLITMNERYEGNKAV